MKKQMLNRKGNGGITLIALVITIIVLLILAGVSIAMLTGENGVLTQASKSKMQTEIAEAKEQAKLEIMAWRAEKIANGEDATLDDATVKTILTGKDYVETLGETSFTTENGYEITYSELYSTIPTTGGGSSGIYSIPGLEEQAERNIELFEYEIIDDGEVASTTNSSLPMKTAKITGIKQKYCNSIKYNIKPGSSNNTVTNNTVTNNTVTNNTVTNNTVTNNTVTNNTVTNNTVTNNTVTNNTVTNNTVTNNTVTDTNYEIIFEGEKITDTLVIPYQVEIDGEMYKIIEADITLVWQENGGEGYALPRVKTIIYPNTIECINRSGLPSNGDVANHVIETIILPENLENIGRYAFYNCINLKEITIPSTVKTIGYGAFWSAESLKTVNYTGTEEQWSQIIIDYVNEYLTDAENINFNYTGK